MTAPSYEPTVYTPTPMGQAALTTTPTVVYTVPTGKAALVQKVVLSNTTLAPIDVYVGLLSTGGVGDATNRIMHDVPIGAEGSVAFDMMQVVNGGIAAHADAAGLTLTISGMLFDLNLAAGSWDERSPNESWDSVPNTVTWDTLDVDHGVAWDGYPAGKSWDAFPAGLSWDEMINPDAGA